MKSKRAYSGKVRQQQRQATREVILQTAIGAMAEVPPGGLTHEAVAAKAGVAIATVYRHFATRADLIEAAWAHWCQKINLDFPQSEDALLEWTPRLFRTFAKHESLVRTRLAVDTGRDANNPGDAGNRAKLMRALAPLTAGLTPPSRARVLAIFLALCSAPVWRLLRDQGQLSGEGAAKAIEWALRNLLEGLRRRPMIGTPDKDERE
jgi:AcrR family transcriptional regulator